MMVVVVMIGGEANRLSLIDPDDKGEERKKIRAQWDERDAKGELEECREEGNGSVPRLTS